MSSTTSTPSLDTFLAAVVSWLQGKTTPTINLNVNGGTPITPPPPPPPPPPATLPVKPVGSWNNPAIPNFLFGGPNYPLNKRIDGLPVRPLSSAMIAHLNGVPVHPIFGQSRSGGIPWQVYGTVQDVVLTQNNAESDPA